MKTETAANAAVTQAALAFDGGLIAASKHIRARSQHSPRGLLPMAIGAVAVVILVLPKSMRRPLVTAALPIAVGWLRGFFR